MEGGIKRVERALTLGYERRADAYEVLAKGYNTLALVYSDRGSEERRQYEQKRNEAYKKLTDLAPGNAKYVRKYARAMTSHEEREALYRRAIRVNRDDLELRVGLISTLLQLNKIGEATEETNALIKMGSVQEQRELLEALVSELRDKGASDAAARLEAVVSAGR
jgi:beta-phosphoglucomutase-like phosphatase (HAD superfamily)